MTEPHTTAAPSRSEVAAGQAAYSPGVLAWYDWLVLGVSNQFVWRCPSRRLLALYQQHASGNHLDVGVGTGYFLDRCHFPIPQPRIVLADLNLHCLSRAATRTARYSPQTLRYNVFEPLPTDLPRFDSIGLNYVLHCLPGSMTEKAVVFDHLRTGLNPGGVLFGSTILAEGVPVSFPARRLMAFYNHRRIFSNMEDRLDDLRHELESRFARTTLDIIGSVALFSAHVE